MNLDKSTRRRAAGGALSTTDRWKESSRLFFGSNALSQVRCGVAG